MWQLDFAECWFSSTCIARILPEEHIESNTFVVSSRSSRTYCFGTDFIRFFIEPIIFLLSWEDGEKKIRNRNVADGREKLTQHEHVIWFALILEPFCQVWQKRDERKRAIRSITYSAWRTNSFSDGRRISSLSFFFLPDLPFFPFGGIDHVSDTRSTIERSKLQRSPFLSELL